MGGVLLAMNRVPRPTAPDSGAITYQEGNRCARKFRAEVRRKGRPRAVVNPSPGGGREPREWESRNGGKVTRRAGDPPTSWSPGASVMPNRSPSARSGGVALLARPTITLTPPEGG